MQPKYSGVELVNLVNQLKSCIALITLGGASIELDIPSIVVSGNQSVGKSSLLSQICGFSLPKGDGTCTRSCTEIRLQTKGSEFKCQISIRREFGANSQPLDKVEETGIAETKDALKVAELIKKAEQVTAFSLIYLGTPQSIDLYRKSSFL
jgi:GTPase SAR1 family protein